MHKRIGKKKRKRKNKKKKTKKIAKRKNCQEIIKAAAEKQVKKSLKRATPVKLPRTTALTKAVNLIVITMLRQQTVILKNRHCMSDGFRKDITYNCYDEMYYQWLQLHHPTYAKEWHTNAIILEPLSAVRTRLDDEPTTLKQSQAKVTRKEKGKAPVEINDLDTFPICMNPYSSVYFGMGDWVKCYCQQWLHEGCIYYKFKEPDICPLCAKL